jgi:hypothetical protein
MKDNLKFAILITFLLISLIIAFGATISLLSHWGLFA